jgi:hypothetical protein
MVSRTSQVPVQPAGNITTVPGETSTVEPSSRV